MKKFHEALTQDWASSVDYDSPPTTRQYAFEDWVIKRLSGVIDEYDREEVKT